jgi:hypothetical protein
LSPLTSPSRSDIERNTNISAVLQKRMLRCASRPIGGIQWHTKKPDFFPGLAGLYQRFSPFSYALMRFATGAILVLHGIQKTLNVPIAKFAPNIGAKGPAVRGRPGLSHLLCRIGGGRYSVDRMIGKEF